MGSEWSRDKYLLYGRWAVVIAGTAGIQFLMREHPVHFKDQGVAINVLGIFSLVYLLISTLTWKQVPYNIYRNFNVGVLLAWCGANIYFTFGVQDNFFALLLLWVIFENLLEAPLYTGILTTLIVTSLYSVVFIVSRLVTQVEPLPPWSTFLLIYFFINGFGIAFTLYQHNLREREGQVQARMSVEMDQYNEVLEGAYKTAKKLSDSLESQERMFGDLRRRFLAVAEVTNVLGVMRNAEALLKILVKKSKEEMHTEGAFILMVQGEKLKIAISEGLPEPMVKMLEMPRGEGVLGKLTIDGGILNLGEEDISRSLTQSAQSFGRLKNILCVGLKTLQDMQPFGILGVANLYEKETFDTDDEAFLTTLATNASNAFKNALLVEDLQRSYDEIVLALAQAIEAKDPYTRGHVSRVRTLSLQVADLMGISDADKEILGQASILHDVGKISTPENILLKTGPLNTDERGKMEDHATAASSILSGITSLNPKVLELIIHHHERFDGEGYPDGLKGSEIPLGAQIIAVADTYDAMTSDRPYRKGYVHEKAIKLLTQCAGTQFGPKVLHAFCSLFK